MRIVAVMACRNEAAYLPTCLHHLVSNGIEFAIVDNGSTDNSIEIARGSEFKPYLVDIIEVPYSGQFELEVILKAQASLAESIKTDWVMHICPDEILHPNREGLTLHDEIKRFDRAGFNVVNFDEFVFLPVDGDWQNGHRGLPTMRHYYFFEPSRFRQMRLWKKGFGLSNVSSGGHRLEGDKRFAPESLVLRHYPFRNQQHAHEKFPGRKFSETELQRGWHHNRHGFLEKNFLFPPAHRLELLPSAESFSLSRAKPWTKHYWELKGDEPFAAATPRISTQPAREPPSAPAVEMKPKIAVEQPSPARAMASSAVAAARSPSLFGRVRRALLPDGTLRQQRYHALRVQFDRWLRGPSESRTRPSRLSKWIDGSELSVVVMSLNAPPELVDAVRSLATQLPVPEIIVINSGRAGAAERLKTAGLDVTVIESSRRLYPGAARNLGIAASHGTWVAFLAADCTAEPGWVAARLSAHRGGADLVSSPVINMHPWNPFATAAHVLLFATRLPGSPENLRQHYGASYRKELFSLYGSFAPDLRAGEDTEFHRRLPQCVARHFESRVLTTHRNSRNLVSLLRDQYARGRRRALVSAAMGAPIHPHELSRMGRAKAKRLFSMTLRSTAALEWPHLFWAYPWILPATLAYRYGIRTGSLDAARNQPLQVSEQLPCRRLVGLLQFHNDHAYLSGYLENVSEQADGIIVLNDGSNPPIGLAVAEHPKVLELLCIAPRKPHVWDERRNQRVLLECARNHRAEWVIALDADERLERGFRERALPLMDKGDVDGVSAYSLILRELWDTPLQFRNDGLWGRKRRPRLFRPRLDHVQSDTALHGNWAPQKSGKVRGHYVPADLIIYHLGMISAIQRERKQKKYRLLDPECHSQTIGYDYLTDASGLTVEVMEPGREYAPLLEFAPDPMPEQMTIDAAR